MFQPCCRGLSVVGVRTANPPIIWHKEFLKYLHIPMFDPYYKVRLLKNDDDLTHMHGTREAI